MPYNLDKMCRRAVDRNGGELVDINLEYFADDKLLAYIARRSGKLKRIRISCCYGMVCNGLVKQVQKFPLLEELCLTHTSITTEGIEALGRYCPKLKSFGLNNSCYMDLSEDTSNEEALAIAKNLPSLHHLQLIRNTMKNKGLEAILDGCPNLLSLNIRQCSNLNLNEVLSSRISQHIKDVKYPRDSLAGLTFSFDSMGDDSSDCTEYDDMSDE